MKPEKLKTVYFLGIGGIGMSALARYLHAVGVSVSGYDKTHTLLTQQLEAEGISIHYEDIPAQINPNTDLVVFTPAVPKTLLEFQKVIDLKLPLMKRSELLEIITNGHHTLAVAGTHGKTTVSTMLAHIMYTSHQGCTAFLGGIAKNYDSNLLLNTKSKYMVAEADEFDRSFLKLHPSLAIITSADADHLDIYHEHKNLLDSFAAFASNVSADGIVLIKAGIDLPMSSISQARKFTYALQDDADFCVKDLTLIDGKYQFTLLTPEGEVEGFHPILSGLFNIENAVAAAAGAWLSGVEADHIVTSINSFNGVRRRFDRRIDTEGLLYIDDYAHHPEELKACITSVRKLYPERKITGIFQPHLYTRTRDFAGGFAESLSLLDELILLEIYPARELPIEGVTSAMLLDLTPIKDKKLLSKEEAITYLKNNKPDVLLTLGAGDIDQLVPIIEKLWI